MSSAKPSPKSDIQAFFDRLKNKLSAEQGITEKKMFGTTALCVKGKVFVFPWKGTLVFKLPAERVAEIIAAKKGNYFDPGHGRTSKEWVAVKPLPPREWSKLVQEAKEFVG
jgi:Rieske Fe-S protein